MSYSLINMIQHRNDGLLIIMDSQAHTSNSSNVYLLDNDGAQLLDNDGAELLDNDQ